VLSESYSGGPLNGLALTNGYDAFLRRRAVGLSSEPSTLTQYGYDAASRLLSVTNGNYNATYAFLANSPLVSQLVLKSNATTRMTTLKQYDNVNRLTQISNAPSADAAVRFDYRYNSASQRVGVTNADQSYWVYSYDALGQVTSGKKYWSDGTPVDPSF
jgi:YD repeat-containing protein